MRGTMHCISKFVAPNAISSLRSVAARKQQSMLLSVVAKASAARVPEPSKGIPVGVKAYFLASQIDLHNIHSDAYTSSGRKELQSKCVTMTLNAEGNQHITVFKFGGVVMFNIPEEQHMDHLDSIRKAAFQAADKIEHTETYRVIIHENLENPSVIKAEHVNVRALDMNNIIIIGTIMAQSVALDYYASIVDGLLEQFVKMNQTIHTTGNMRTLQAERLHQLVAYNNVVMTNVLSKVRPPLFAAFLIGNRETDH